MSGATHKPNVRWECTIENLGLRGLKHESGVDIPWQARGEGSTRKEAWEAAKVDAATTAQRSHVNMMLASVPGDAWFVWFNLYQECHMNTLSTKPLAGWTATTSTGQQVTIKRIYTRRKL